MDKEIELLKGCMDVLKERYKLKRDKFEKEKEKDRMLSNEMFKLDQLWAKIEHLKKQVLNTKKRIEQQVEVELKSTIVEFGQQVYNELDSVIVPLDAPNLVFNTFDTFHDKIEKLYNYLDMLEGVYEAHRNIFIISTLDIARLYSEVNTVNQLYYCYVDNRMFWKACVQFRKQLFHLDKYI